MKFQLATLLLTVIAAANFFSSASAGILIANDTDEAISVFIKGVDDSDYRAPYRIAAKSKIEIPVPNGKYYVATRYSNDKWEYLGWQHYSNHRLTYKVTLRSICAPEGTPIVNSRMVESEVAYAERYWCSKCSGFHTRWRAGWGAVVSSDK